MKKRLLSLILAVALFVQMIPAAALADTERFLIAQSQLNAAVAITGLAEGAAGWHDGMQPSRHMNAAQMTGYLEGLIEHDLSGMMDTMQSVQVHLYKLEQDQPAHYEQLVGNGQALTQLNDLSAEMRTMMDELSYYHDELEAQSDYIYTNRNMPYNTDFTEKQRIQYSRRIQEAYQTVLKIIPQVAQNHLRWEEKMDAWLDVLGSGQSMNRGTSGSSELRTLITALDEMTVSPIKETVLFKQDRALNDGASTRLSRLSASEPLETMHITVLNTDDFGVRITGPDQQTLEGVSITMTDLDRSGYTSSAVTQNNGSAVFSVKEYSADSDGYMNVSFTASKEGYRSRTVDWTEVKKGGIYSAITLEKDDSRPYIRSVTFNGKDVFTQELGVYYSPWNDYRHKLLVTVIAPEPCTVEMFYTSIDGETVSGGSCDITQQGMQQLTFEGDWLRRFKPEEKIYFQIKTKENQAECFDTMLRVMRGVKTQPVYDESGVVSNPVSFGSLGFTLPSSFVTPFGSAQIGMDLPSKYIPKFGMNLDGSTYVALGVVAPLEDGSKTSVEWKTEDQIDLEKRQRAVEKEGYFARELAKANAVWKGQEPKRIDFLGSLKLEAAMFFLLQGRYVSHTEDEGSVRGQFTVGANLTFSEELTAQYGYFFVNYSLSLGASLGFMMGCEMDIRWTENNWPIPSNLKESQTGTGFSIMARLGIGVSAGIGAKNILSVSVNGFGFINFLLMMTMQEAYFRVTGGASISLLVKAFLFKSQLPLWKTGERVIFDTRGLSSPGLQSAPSPAALSAGTEMEIFTAPAVNPDLKADAVTGILTPISMSMPEMKYANLNGWTYGFYLTEDHRLKWIHLGSGLSDTLDEWYPSGKFKDYAFDVQPAQGHGLSGIVVSILSTEQFIEKTITDQAGQTTTIQVPDPGSCFVHMYFLQEQSMQLFVSAESAPVHHVGAKMHGDMVYPQLQVDAYTDEANNQHYGVFLGVSPGYGTCDTSYITYDYQLIDGEPVPFVKPYVYSHLHADEMDRKLTVAGDARHVNLHNEFISYYDLKRDPNGSSEDDMQLLHAVGDYAKNTTSGIGAMGRFVLDTGEIATIRALSHREVEADPCAIQTDDVFYLKAESGSNHQYGLWGARVEHRNNRQTDHQPGKYLSHVTITDYDVSIPASDFQIKTIAGTTYIYWMESVVPEETGDSAHYLVKGVAFDIPKNIVSEPFVIADITPENKNDVPVSIYLSDNGKGYYITDSESGREGSVIGTINIFPLQLVAGLKLESVSMEYSMVTAGSYEEMLFSLRNTGNVAIAGFDVDVIMKDKNGEKTVQTLHVDCLDETKNSNAIAGAEPSTALGLYRINGFSDNSNGDEWYLKRRTTGYAESGSSSADTSWAQTSLLMPTAVGCYKSSLWIGPDWHGETDIHLQVKKIYAVSNWASTVAVEGGSTRSAGVNAASQDETLIFEVAKTDAGARVTPVGHAATLRQSALPVFSTDITFDRKKLDTSLEDLELDYRLFNQNGERMVELILSNRAAMDARSARLGGISLRAYADGNKEAETFRYTFPQEIVNGQNYTITLPVSWLKGSADPAELTVEVLGKDYEEAESMDNSFVIKLRNDELTFLRHPADFSAVPGGNAEFAVEVSGGAFPYAYSWQMRKGKTGAWSDIPGAAEEKLILTGVTAEMDDLQVRCVVTDGNFNKAVSAAAALGIIRLPQTGDQSQPLLWGMAAMLSLAAGLLIAKRKKGRYSPR